MQQNELAVVVIVQNCVPTKVSGWWCHTQGTPSRVTSVEHLASDKPILLFVVLVTPNNVSEDVHLTIDGDGVRICSRSKHLQPFLPPACGTVGIDVIDVVVVPAGVKVFFSSSSSSVSLRAVAVEEERQASVQRRAPSVPPPRRLRPSRCDLVGDDLLDRWRRLAGWVLQRQWSRLVGMWPSRFDRNGWGRNGFERDCRRDLWDWIELWAGTAGIIFSSHLSVIYIYIYIYPRTPLVLWKNEDEIITI